MSNTNINLKINDRVMFIQDGKRLYGKIHAFFDNLNDPIVLVDFEDENGTISMKKVRLADLVIVMETEVKNSEPVEKSGIKITPDEFKEVGVKIISRLSDMNPFVEYAFTTFLAELHKALFF